MPDTVKLIKSVKALPSSFCLDNYSGTEFLDDRGWADALTLRSGITVLDMKLSDEKDTHFNPSLHEGLEGFLSSIFEDPLFQAERNQGQQLKDIPYGPLAHLTVQDLYEHIRFLETTLKYKRVSPELDTFFIDYISGKCTEGLSEPARKIVSMTVDSLNSFPNIRKSKLYLSVDLSCSDRQLEDEFLKMLSVARSSRGIIQSKQSYSQKDFERWHRLAILPYLDLTLWANVTDTTIAQHVMAEAILPNRIDIDTTQAIQKTVAPLAKKLLQLETLNTLWAQVGNKKE